MLIRALCSFTRAETFVEVTTKGVPALVWMGPGFHTTLVGCLLCVRRAGSCLRIAKCALTGGMVIFTVDVAGCAFQTVLRLGCQDSGLDQQVVYVIPCRLRTSS